MKSGTVAFFPNNVDYERISEYENMIAIDLEMLNYTSDHIEYYTTKKYDELCRLFTNLYNAWVHCWITLFYHDCKQFCAKYLTVPATSPKYRAGRRILA